MAAGVGLGMHGLKKILPIFYAFYTIWVKSSIEYVHRLFCVFVYFMKIDPVEATTHFVA
jgi:hypothetical protein